MCTLAVRYVTLGKAGQVLAARVADGLRRGRGREGGTEACRRARIYAR